MHKSYLTIFMKIRVTGNEGLWLEYECSAQWIWDKRTPVGGRFCLDLPCKTKECDEYIERDALGFVPPSLVSSLEEDFKLKWSEAKQTERCY